MNWRKQTTAHLSADKVRIIIDREPPPTQDEGILADYHDTISQLETLYAQKVQNSGMNPAELRDAIDDKSPKEDQLLGKLADMFHAGGLDNSEVAAQIDDHETRLQNAALAEQDRLRQLAEDKIDLTDKGLHDFMRGL